MKLPKHFTIKGEQWSVELSETLDEQGLVGLAEKDTRRIQISSESGARERKLILLHEFIHACLYELHIDLEDGIEEVLADGLAKCLLDSFHVRPRA